jgi:hypothetical protein
LEKEVQDKERQRQATEIRLEIAQAMPRLAQDEALKKTTQQKRRRRRLHQRQRRRAKKSR